MSSSDPMSESNGEGDSIKVFLRVRPSDDTEGLVNYGQCLEVQKPDTVILKTKTDRKVFTFDHVADPEITQEEVFSNVGKKTIECCVAGYNGTIFAYGQTGSGKTFTMIGPSEKGDNFHHELRGVIPRSFEYLFNLVNREREKQGDRFEFLIRCSFLEIYNEQIFDLMDPTCRGLNLRENMKKGVFVDGLIEQTVNSPHEAYSVLTAGWLNRRVAATSMNRESSRSHAVFTVSIETKEKKAGVANVRVSQLHLVDLAGSERQKDTRTEGIRLKEAGNINKSLSTLGNVIMALVDIAHGKQRFVPYRNSKLSFLLRDALGGNSKTFIIANVHPGAKCFGETLSTLNFARRAKMIKNKAVVNQDTQGNVSHLQAEIRRLKEQLSQYQAEGVPRPMGPAGEDRTDASSAPTSNSQPIRVMSEEDRKWKRQFYQAMKMKEEGMKEIKERVSELENLCRKKDKFIQSTKMIIRFRENTISQLQKKQPATEPTKKEKSLQEEMRTMKELLDHNPEVLKYAIENKKLREEVQRLKSMETVRAGLEFTQEQCAELDRAFQTLKENVDDTGNPRFGATPSSTPVTTPVPTATMEKHQAQLQAVQAQLDSARQEAAEQKEVFHRKQIEMEAELAAAKKSLQEMETALEGMKDRNRLDRDEMHDMHMQTIKTITTPKKKPAYQLRSRLITVTSSTPSTSTPISPRTEGDLMETTPPRMGSLMGIIDEEVPDHVMEQCNEALSAELQKLGLKNNSLQSQLEQSEAKVMKLTQQVSKLEYQTKQENELHAKLKQSHDSLTKQIEQLNRELADLKNTYEITRGEAEDFRLMLQSVDKQNTEKLSQCHVREQEQEKNISELQNSLVKAEKLAASLQQALDEGYNEKVTLKERNANLEAEISFIEEQRKDLEDRLRAEVAAKKDMQEEMGSLLERFDSECAKTNQLSQRLKEGSDSTQRLGALNDQIGAENEELRAVLADKSNQYIAVQSIHNQLTQELKAVSDSTQRLGAPNNQICGDNQELRAMLVDKESKINQLSKDLEELTLNKTNLEQKATETKEAMSQILSNLQDVKSELARQNNRVEDLDVELTLAEHEKEEMRLALERVQTDLSEAEASSQMAANTYEEKINSLRAELSEMSCQHSNLLTEMEKQEFLLRSSQTDCEDLNEYIEDLQKQMQEKADMINSLDEKLADVHLADFSTVVVESVPSPEVKQKLEEWEKLQASQDKLAEISESYKRAQDELENMREEKNREIGQLKEKLKDIEKLQEEKGQLEVVKEQLRKSMEEAAKTARLREERLQERLVAMEEKLRGMEQATGEADRVRVENKNLQEKFMRLEANSSLLQEDYDQLQCEIDRISSLEKTHFEEKDELRSKLEVVMEEKSKQMEAINKLEREFEEVSKENAKLVGHQNFKQKIQYHHRLKLENNELREELKKAHQECFGFKKELDSARKRLDHVAAKKSREQAPLQPSKENIYPVIV